MSLQSEKPTVCGATTRGSRTLVEGLTSSVLCYETKQTSKRTRELLTYEKKLDVETTLCADY